MSNTLSQGKVPLPLLLTIVLLLGLILGYSGAMIQYEYGQDDDEPEAVVKVETPFAAPAQGTPGPMQLTATALVRAATQTAAAPRPTATPVYTPTALPTLTTAEEYLERGIALWKNRLFDEPIADLTRAIELDPTLADAYFYRGWVYQEGYRDQETMNSVLFPDEALADYDKAIELDPTHSRAYNNRAMLFWWDDLARVQADLERAIEIDPAYAYALHNVVLIYSFTHQDERLLETCEHMATLTPPLSCGSYWLLRAAREMNDYGQMVAALTQVIEYYESHDHVEPDMYIERGQAYMQLGQYDQAIADFTRVLEAYETWDEVPEDAAETVLARAQAYAAADKYEDAVIDYTYLIVQAPGNADYYRMRGDVHYANEDMAAALADYEQAASLLSLPDHDLIKRIDEIKTRLNEDSSGD